MKKIIKILLISVLVFSLLTAVVGCKEKGKEKKQETEVAKYYVVVENGTGGGTDLELNTTLAIVPTIPAGKKFVNWTEGGVVVSTDNPYIISVSKDTTLVANFVDLISYDITVVGGTANKDAVEEGSTCTVTATIPTGKKFVKWTIEGDEKLYDTNPFTFLPTSDTTITAEFRDLQTYTISVEGGIGGGSVFEGNSTYAVANQSGKTFVNWTDGEEVVSTDSLYKFTPTKSMNLKANYVEQTAFETPTRELASPQTPSTSISLALDRMFRNYYATIPEGAMSRHESIFNNSDAFADGDQIDYVLLYIYTSADAEIDEYVSCIKWYQNTITSLTTETEYTQTAEWSYGGNYYISGADVATFLSGDLGQNYADTTKYYFASQLIAKKDSTHGNSQISPISERYFIEMVGTFSLVTIEGGTAPGGRQGEGPYTTGVMQGESVTVTATIPAGSTLTGWMLDGVLVEGETQSTFTFVPTADCLVQAVFDSAQPIE